MAQTTRARKVSASMLKAYKAGIQSGEIASLLQAVGGSWSSIAQDNREMILNKLVQDLPKIDEDIQVEVGVTDEPNRILVDYYTRDPQPFGSKWGDVDKEMRNINKILRAAGLKIKYTNNYYNNRGTRENPYMQHELYTEIISEAPKKQPKEGWDSYDLDERERILKKGAEFIPENENVTVDINERYRQDYNLYVKFVGSDDDKETYDAVNQGVQNAMRLFKGFGLNAKLTTKEAPNQFLWLISITQD